MASGLVRAAISSTHLTTLVAVPAGAVLDGSSDAVDLYLNVLVDDADQDVSTERDRTEHRECRIFVADRGGYPRAQVDRDGDHFGVPTVRGHAV